jgi:nucleoid-associated protein YgaU
MTALWLSPDPSLDHPAADRAPSSDGGPGLRLVSNGTARARPDAGNDWDTPDPWARPISVVPDRRPATRRRVSPAVRRRRALLAFMGLLLVGLALPLSGTGGNSHATGSALAETGAPVSYTVRPGDTLWTIAERVDPSADPRPIVAQLSAQTGSDTVVPGERIILP